MYTVTQGRIQDFNRGEEDKYTLRGGDLFMIKTEMLIARGRYTLKSPPATNKHNRWRSNHKTKVPELKNENLMPLLTKYIFDSQTHKICKK